VDPGCLLRIRDGIADYLRRHGHRRVREIVGGLQAP
jgi:hypothetical protein